MDMITLIKVNYRTIIISDETSQRRYVFNNPLQQCTFAFNRVLNLNAHYPGNIHRILKPDTREFL